MTGIPTALLDLNYDDVAGTGPFIIDDDDPMGVQSWAHQRQLVRTSDGTLYVVMRQDPTPRIYVKKSVDNGQNWIDQTQISTYAGMNGYDQVDACIAVDSNDYLHVVWKGKADGFTTHDQIWYAKYTDSWAAPVRISDYAGMNVNAQWTAFIAVDSDDYLHVVWDGTATGYAFLQIWYTKYTDSWSAPLRISTLATMATNNQRYPSIAVDSSDNLHAVWYGSTDTYIDAIWYRKFIVGWGAITRISTTERVNQLPSIGVDSDDNLHVIWHAIPATPPNINRIWYSKYTTSWSAPIYISTYAGMVDYAQIYPSIAVDVQDYIHAVWRGKATGHIDFNKVWHALYTDSWATPECLQPIGHNIGATLRWSRWPR